MARKTKEQRTLGEENEHQLTFMQCNKHRSILEITECSWIFHKLYPSNLFDTQAIIILVNGMVAKYVNVVLNLNYYI